MEPNGIWAGMGISDADLEAKAEWIRRDHPRFRGAMVMYFRTAASLIRFSKYDFSLLSLALFQTIVGLEKMLRLHYGDKPTAFKTLLWNAVREGVIADSSFSTRAVLPKEMLKRMEIALTTNAEEFAELIPMLRTTSSMGFIFWILSFCRWRFRFARQLMPYWMGGVWGRNDEQGAVRLMDLSKIDVEALRNR